MKSRDKWDTFYSSKKREPFLHLTEEQVNAILIRFSNAKSALDIGCGEGQLLIQLEQRNISAVGIDVSDVALKEARKHVKGTLIEGDFEEFVFSEEEKFDLVFVKFVIAFIEDIPTFFKKIQSVLKTSGGFILLAPVINGHLEKKSGEEIFVEQSVLDVSMPKYFSEIKEEILHTEGNRKLALYTCIKSD